MIATELTNLKISYPLSITERNNLCQRIYAGVAWPGKKQGYIVIIALSWEKHFNEYNMYLIDEFESFDLREIIYKCAEFHKVYTPDLWVGDNHNEAADALINEVNSKFFNNSNKGLYITQTLILEVTNIYSYILPKLRLLIQSDKRLLYLKDSFVQNYMREIEPSDIAVMKAGEYPAIEALAFAALELSESSNNDYADDDSDLVDSYSIKTKF